MNDFTLSTIGQFAKLHPGLTESSVRWHVFNATSNGLEKAGAIRRVGRRVYIVVERYQAWIDAGAKASA